MPPLDLRIDVDRLAIDRHVLALVVPVCDEILRRANHPGATYQPDDHPDRNQVGFHQATERIRLIFGGNRSGKSRAAAQEIKWWLEENHPYLDTPKAPRVYVVSANYRTLRKGIYEHLKVLLAEWEIARVGPMIAGAGGDLPHFIEMKKGGVVEFISAQGGEPARRKLQAAEVDLLALDEEIDGETWNEIQMRGLSTGGRFIISATLEKSEDWLVDLESAAQRGDPGVKLFRFDTRVAVERGHADRESLDYILATFSKDDIEVRILGHSRSRMGLVYPTFGPDHIIDPFEIPPEWTRYCSIDPGARICAALWLAVAPDEHAYVYREAYLRGRTYHDLARFIFEAEGYLWDEDKLRWKIGPKTELVHTRWIDPSAFHHETSGTFGVGSLLVGDYGLECAPALNDVLVGIERVQQMLTPAFDGAAQLRVFRTCEHLIREFGLYRYGEDRGGRNSNERKQRPVKRNDHAMDALRYAVLGGLETVQQGAEPTEDDPGISSGHTMQDRLRAWRRRRQRRLAHGPTHIHAAGLGSQF